MNLANLARDRGEPAALKCGEHRHRIAGALERQTVMSKREQRERVVVALVGLGFSFDESVTLRRADVPTCGLARTSAAFTTGAWRCSSAVRSSRPRRAARLERAALAPPSG